MFDSHPTEETFVLVCESSGEISALGAINKKMRIEEGKNPRYCDPKAYTAQCNETILQHLSSVSLFLKTFKKI